MMPLLFSSAPPLPIKFPRAGISSCLLPHDTSHMERVGNTRVSISFPDAVFIQAFKAQLPINGEPISHLLFVVVH